MLYKYDPREYEKEDVIEFTERRGGINNIPNEIIRHNNKIKELEESGFNDDWEFAQDLKNWVKWLEIIYNEKNS